MDWKDRAQELVDQHWDYHDVVIPVFTPNSNAEWATTVKNFGKWYKEIGKHFYKHAIEDIKSGKIKIAGVTQR